MTNGGGPAVELDACIALAMCCSDGDAVEFLTTLKKFFSALRHRFKGRFIQASMPHFNSFIHGFKLDTVCNCSLKAARQIGSKPQSSNSHQCVPCCCSSAKSHQVTHSFDDLPLCLREMMP